MAFKMRSGNKPEFKNIGSSALKKDEDFNLDDYHKKDLNLDGTVTRAEKKAYKKAAKLDRKSGAAKRTRKVKRASRKLAEAREREETGITKAEQLTRRVGDWGKEKSQSKIGKLARGVVNTMIDPTSTDVGLLATAAKSAKQRIKQSIRGELPEGERLLTGEQGLLRQARDVYRTVKDKRHGRLMDPTNVSGKAVRYRTKRTAMTKKKKY